MWQRYGNTWVYKEMPIITVEPFAQEGQPNGPKVWQACCGGRPVPQIAPSSSSADVMTRTEKYYDARIEMTTVNQPWR